LSRAATRYNGKLIDGKLIDGKLIDGKLIDGKLIDGELIGIGFQMPTSTTKHHCP